MSIITLRVCLADAKKAYRRNELPSTLVKMKIQRKVDIDRGEPHIKFRNCNGYPVNIHASDLPTGDCKIKCYWHMGEIENTDFVWGICEKYMIDINGAYHFYLTGRFCSISCVLAHAYDSRSCDSDMLSNTILMWHIISEGQELPAPSPHFSLMKCNGGTLNDPPKCFNDSIVMPTKIHNGTYVLHDSKIHSVTIGKR